MGDACERCGSETGMGRGLPFCVFCQDLQHQLAKGAAAERARIVAWLRSAWTPSAEYAEILQTTAAYIERGEHVAGDAKESPND